ncbi:membrane protein [Longispora fulva]|uniref:Putative membrane protein YeiB n=1 Tax=Longispora fulva TaxID=619741 RepID=A0A8J7GGT5_9ACTN|nr:heparan-alpha-glucosaminide N-acetyltransferase domain-containing protein [Longispora fulva]MBG6135893.1 putative membrane protein YeiB [Longispora fulva]GIG55864.1 membrane protein [Longispora fulva]
MITHPTRRLPAAVAVTGPRLGAIDVARGLAVIGMILAHLAFGGTEVSLSDPGTWPGLVNGRSSILFMTLAGLSLTFIAGRPRPHSGERLVRARVRVFTRAALLLGIGAALDLLNGGAAVILAVYGVLFLLATPFLRLSARWLLVSAGIVALTGPVLANLVPGHGGEPQSGSLATAVKGVPTDGVDLPIAARFALEILFTGTYPAVIWLAFLLAGMGVGRLALDNRRTAGVVFGVGATISVTGYGLGHLPGLPDPLDRLATSSPHSGGWGEVLGSGGLAIAVIGLLLLLCRYREVRTATWPLAALGSITLTVYVLHIASFLLLSQEAPEHGAGESPWFAAVSVAAALAFAVLWRTFRTSGPLEGVVTWISNRAADTGRQPTADTVFEPTKPTPAT